MMFVSLCFSDAGLAPERRAVWKGDRERDREKERPLAIGFRKDIHYGKPPVPEKPKKPYKPKPVSSNIEKENLSLSSSSPQNHLRHRPPKKCKSLPNSPIKHRHHAPSISADIPNIPPPSYQELSREPPYRANGGVVKRPTSLERRHSDKRQRYHKGNVYQNVETEDFQVEKETVL